MKRYNESKLFCFKGVNDGMMLYIKVNAASLHYPVVDFLL